MKTWELTNSIIRDFYPALIPGRSFVLHQDFAHWYTPSIRLTHYGFRNCFEPVYNIAGSERHRIGVPGPNFLRTDERLHLFILFLWH